MSQTPFTPRWSPGLQAEPRASRAARSEEDRLVSGVCGGLGAHYNLDPSVLRVGFAWGSALGGLGLIAYAALAVALPLGQEQPEAIASPVDDVGPKPQRRPWVRRAAVRIGFALQFIGFAILLSAIGLAPPAPVLIVFSLAAIGGALLWRAVSGRIDDRETPLSGLAAGARVAGGLVLLGAGGVLSVRPSGVGSAGIALIVAAVVASGVALLFGPSLVRARREAQHERLERIRSEERAAVAARLHDSVLQTFAVIQRLDDASPRVQSIARSQERELRAWLYGGEQVDGPQTLASALRAVTEEVELLHGVTVDLVQPTDAPIDADVEALVLATREAMTNAARHSGVDQLSVLARVTPSEIAIYVRDRGQGFDPVVVPEDRRGVRDSLIGRMQRHGGTATLTTAPGEGTEVELQLPRRTGGSGS